MTLLITTVAAIICTLIWYNNDNRSKLKIGFLCLMYWGATIMWTVDAIFEYIELKAGFFTPVINDMINDAFLGICVVVLGLIIYIIMLFVKDPKGVLKSELFKNKN